MALAVTVVPAAVTISAKMRLSIVRPRLPLSQPNPPPSVRPAMPVMELMPTGVARPYACVAPSTSPSVAPGPTRAARIRESTWTAFIAKRSIIAFQMLRAAS